MALPVAMIGLAPSVILVPADAPYKDLKEFIAYVKANGSKLNEAHAGVGEGLRHAEPDAGHRAGHESDTAFPYAPKRPCRCTLSHLIPSRQDIHGR